MMNRLLVIQGEQSNQKIVSSPQVLAIAAGKGGVGKSSIAVNLALSLKKKGFRVGLVDADVYGPSVKQMLPAGLDPDVDPANPDRWLPGMALGIPFISVAHFRKGAAIVRAPIANQIIDQFLKRVNWGELDYLLVDFPPGTGDIQLSLMQKVEIAGAVLVTTPQAVAVLDVRKAMELFNQMAIPILGVVENMSYLDILGQRVAPFGCGGGVALSKEFSAPFLGEIPIDPLICTMGDLGQSLLDRHPDSPGAIAFDHLSRAVLEQVEQLANSPFYVRQKDVCHLEVDLGEGWRPLSLHALQLHCPCARCERGKKCQEEVSLLEFSKVGRYAIKVKFSSGCSQGIYSLGLLTRILNS